MALAANQWQPGVPPVDPSPLTLASTGPAGHSSLAVEESGQRCGPGCARCAFHSTFLKGMDNYMTHVPVHAVVPTSPARVKPGSCTECSAVPWSVPGLVPTGLM